MLVLLPTIERMIEAEMSHKEIEAELGLERDRPVHNLLKRHRRKPHIDRCIFYFYNHEHIQTKTGVAPLSLRHSA